MLDPETQRNDTSLASLAARAAQGDMAATQQLLKAVAPGMIRSARALMGNAHADVDDVVQQSLIGLVQALPAFRGDCSPQHYANRIVARIAVHAKQRAKVRGDRTDESVELGSIDGHSTPLTEHDAAERRRLLVPGLMESNGKFLPKRANQGGHLSSRFIILWCYWRLWVVHFGSLCCFSFRS